MYACFNPTLVRLAPGLGHAAWAASPGFNPTLVRLAHEKPLLVRAVNYVSIPPWFD